MHKINRNKEPIKLKVKNEEWKREFEENRQLKPNWEEFSNTVAKKDTIKALEEMYAGSCCYCEGKIKSTGYPEIEHFKPKHKYPELCFEYSNLHYCCKRCNITKGKYFDYKMIDPSIDDPEKYLKYVGEIVVSIDGNIHGKIMIDEIKLNERADLKEERAKYLKEVSKNYDLIVNAIEKTINNRNDFDIIKPFIMRFIEDIEIKSKHGESYCTMIKHNFLDKTYLLKEVLLEIK